MLEALKLTKAKVSAVFFDVHGKGLLLGWVPALTLPLISIGNYVAPFRHPFSEGVWIADAAFVTGWILYRMREAASYLQTNPMADLNDRRNHGLQLIGFCEKLLSR